MGLLPYCLAFHPLSRYELGLVPRRVMTTMMTWKMYPDLWLEGRSRGASADSS
jgi:hypothetical protein